MDAVLTVKAAQAAAFFRSQPGFSRLFAALAQKYRSLGKIGGSIKLEGLEEEEIQALASFFRINLKGGRTVRISFDQFAAALQETRFGDVDVVALLQAYLGGALITNRQRKDAARRAREMFFSDLRAGEQGSRGRQWLSKVEARCAGARRAQAMYEQGHPNNLVAFKTILAALNNLPADYLRLPFFAQQIAGHPHAFDGNTSLGRMFLEALRLTQPDAANGFEENAREGVTAVELEAELLYEVKLLRDDLLNFVTCTGLLGDKRARDSQAASAYWRQAWEDDAVLNVPLRELVKYASFSPLRSADERQERKVFIVENSGVFSAITDYAMGQGGRLPPLVCLHGQFKLASWALLDRLAAGGCSLYYSGDFDPEGLLMAERLVKRYPGSAKLWRYGREECMRSLAVGDSLRADVLSASRLKQLDKLSLPELCDVAELLKETNRVGYQEALVDQLVADCVPLAGQSR